MPVNYIRRLMLGAAAAAALGFTLPATGAQAQKDEAADYPERPIRLIVPFAAGGGNDVLARLAGQKAAEILGQPIVIENRPGAGGRPGAEWVINQRHDGYTVLFAPSGAMSIAAAAYPKLAYHPTKSFVPLTMISSNPLVLIVAPDHPAKTVKELVAWAKQNPDKVNYASTSPSFILATELLKLESGMPATMIPYKSSGQMVLSVMSGDVQLSLPPTVAAVPLIETGKVRALAVTSDKRVPGLPDVPTMAEVGLPEVDTRLWSGVFVGTDTPPAIAKKLEAAFQQAVKNPEVSAKLQGMGANPGGMSSAEFRQIVDDEIAAYERVVKAANLTFE